MKVENPSWGSKFGFTFRCDLDGIVMAHGKHFGGLWSKLDFLAANLYKKYSYQKVEHYRLKLGSLPQS